MTSIILSIYAKLKQITDLLTAARAARIDNANTFLSTIAAASTAVSKNIWTDAKAAFLNTTVSSRAAQTTVNAIQSVATTIKNRANVKVSSRLTTVYGGTKVQNIPFNAGLSSGSGIDASYIDISISPVADTSKCIVYVQGSANFWDPGNQSISYPLMARFLNNSTVRVSCGVLFSGAWFTRARLYVAEFK